MLGNFKKVFGEPSTWDNIPEVKIDENNLNIVTDFKATDDGVEIQLNESHYHHVPYNEFLNYGPGIYTEQKPLTYDNIFEEVMKRLAVKPTFKHQCNNCGGVLEMDADKHIFKCPYCNTVYAVGISNIMAR